MIKSFAVALLASSLVVTTAFAQPQPPSTAPTTAPTPQQLFAASLVLRPERFIADSTYPTIIWLTQASQATYAPSSGMKLKLSLAPEQAGTKPIKELGTSEV